MAWLCIWNVYTSFAHNTLSCTFRVCVHWMHFVQTYLSTCCTWFKQRQTAGPLWLFLCPRGISITIGATSGFICLHKVKIPNCLITDLHTYLLTYSLTQSLTYSLTHILTHSLTHSLIHSLTHSFSHSLARSLTHSFSHSFAHSLSRSLTHSLTHSITYLLTNLLTYLLITYFLHGAESFFRS